MKIARLYFTLTVVLILLMSACGNKFKTSEEGNYIQQDSITLQQLQEWQADKLGMFIHFGLYSIPAGVWNGRQVPFYAEQIMNHARIPVDEYEKLATEFNPTKWDADKIVKLAKDAGMRYIVITAKHHDGFCLFKSEYTKYNVVDATPYKQDIIKQLADACKKYNMKLGLYYSIPDWHYPGGIRRGTPDDNTTCVEHVNQLYSPLEKVTADLEDYIVAQITELLTNYGTIETIWFDMGLVTAEQSKRFRNTVKSIQPHCLINGRIMNNQGDYLTLPDNGNIAGYANIPWDNPTSLYSTWGYRSWQQYEDLATITNYQIKRLLNTVSKGGVFLLNIGPTGDGEVPEHEQAVFQNIGQWLKNNGEAIYGTSPSPFIQLENAYCTHKENKLYFIVTDTIKEIECKNLISDIKNIYFLCDTNYHLTERAIEQGVKILIPDKELVYPYTIVAELNTDSVYIVPYYISEKSEHNRYILNDKNAITHAAFDGTGYMSNQMNSWKSWYVDVAESGLYHVFVDYLPEYDEKEYIISGEKHYLSHVFPGVDKMLQTTYAGTIRLYNGQQEICIKPKSRCNALEALGLQQLQIRLEK